MATKELKMGMKAPDFALPNERTEKIRLSDLKGRWVVLYFYPKDNTPGCTVEAIDFTKQFREFQKLNAVILGLSPDSCQSHEKFIQGKKLKVALLSDPEHKVLETYGVWQLKQFLGKKFMGVVRSTFLIDPEGKIACAWRAVKADGHAAEVEEKLKELQREALAQK